MRFSSSAVGFLAFATAINGQQKGFNYGATNNDGSCRKYQDFHAQFTRANSLPNAAGFTSARLYTSIQCGSDNAPIEAIKVSLTQSRPVKSALCGYMMRRHQSLYTLDHIAAIRSIC